MSQTDLNRHKKRKGVTVRRKFGSENEKPEPEVNGSQSLSGETAQTEAIPVPASEFYSIMEKMIGLVDKLSSHEAPEPKEHEGKEVEKVAEAAPEEKKKRPFEMLKELQDADELPPVVAAVPEIPKPSGDWDHVYRRNGSGLVMQIVSIDKKGNQWTHDFTRAGTKFIIEILSKSNTGLRLMHKFQRNERSALIESATTRVEA
jgi:hypothetical protein